MNFSTRLVFVLAFAMPFMIAGCNKKPKAVTCKTDAECRFDASGNEINGLCYNGHCQECIKDTDCKDQKQCVSGRCLAACQTDADCSSHAHCNNNFCVENCASDDSCPSGEVCRQGRCMIQSADFDRGDATASVDCQNIGKVHFDFDSCEVKGEGKEIVAQWARCLQDNPGSRLTIEGHADNRGTPSYNDALAQKRADGVALALRNMGIAASRLTAISYGAARPAVSEDTEDAWQQNRRTEFSMATK